MTQTEARIRKVTTLAGDPAWIVTGYDDVKALLADQRFGRSHPHPERASRVSSSMILGGPMGDDAAVEDAERIRMRRLVGPAFSARRMAQLRPRVAAIVDELLDAMLSRTPPVDLHEAVSFPLPALVICELLGVPYADRAEFQERASRQLDVSRSLEERGQVAMESRAYMGELVDRATTAPGEDMLGMLVREHGHELTDDELRGIASLLLLAGHETTSNMLGLGTLALLRHPEQLAAVRDDADAVGPAVEELLRWLSIVHSAIPRITTADVEIAGVPIPAGQLVFVSLPSGNRDPGFIDSPEMFDIRRGAPGHLAFGHGVHHCLGAPLARMEMRIAFPALLRRFPNLALAEDFSDVQFRSFHFIYGLRSLEVTW
jgi:cytochrome P450